MTLTELRYALMLAKEKHFSKAAKACYVSQPTLSVAINKLEIELGISINLKQTVEGTSLETIRHMVASGMGITVLPYTATQIEFYKSILCTKPFNGKIPQRRIGVAWRVSFTRPKAIDALIQALHMSAMQGICLLPT